uniref:Uncharacterized protein KIAA1644 homolog n=1 Tax=Phallusia mammillata TaxID=59560 RepID=A0A6F9DSV2_9ASCI|nr:uncharacterized protein KIAA1644 homolog [Phallusia mammillata]
MSSKTWEVFWEWFGVFMLVSQVCHGEICESYTTENFVQRAFACPRLSDPDKDVFCCNISSQTTCCDNQTLSVYNINKVVHPALPRQGTVALVAVSIYGGILVILLCVDFLSHFFLLNKKKHWC